MKQKILAFVGIIMLSWCTLFGIHSTPTYAANCDPSFLGFRAWYSGLNMDGNCNIQMDAYKGSDDNMAKFVWTIILNIMIDFSIAAGILTTGFIIYGGYLYIFSGGDPGKTAKGKTTIRNAVVGIIIAVAAGVIIGTVKTILTAQ